MSVDAIVFDLDGTLVDSLADIAAAANHVLADLGLQPHSLNAYRDFVGQGVRRLLERALPADRQDRLGEATTAFLDTYTEPLG